MHSICCITGIYTEKRHSLYALPHLSNQEVDEAVHQSHFNQDVFIAPNGQNIDLIKHVIDSITELIVTNASTSAKRTPLPQIAEYSFGTIPEQGSSLNEIMQ